MLVASVLLACQICPMQRPKAKSPPPFSSNRMYPTMRPTPISRGVSWP